MAALRAPSTRAYAGNTVIRTAVGRNSASDPDLAVPGRFWGKTQPRTRRGSIQFGGHPTEGEALCRVIAEQHPVCDVAHLVDEPDHDRDGGRVAGLTQGLGQSSFARPRAVRRSTEPRRSDSMSASRRCSDRRETGAPRDLRRHDQPVISQQHPPAMTKHRDPPNAGVTP